MNLPDEKQLLESMPGHRPGDMPLLVHNGRFGIHAIVPPDFYELEPADVWQIYFEPIFLQMKQEHDARRGILPTEDSLPPAQS